MATPKDLARLKLRGFEAIEEIEAEGRGDGQRGRVAA